MAHIQRILVPTDFSTCSQAALEYAELLAGAFGATLDLVHVWQAPPYIPPEAMVGTSAGSYTLSALAEQYAEQQMAKLIAQRSNLPVHSTTMKPGDPAEVILELARHVDLIVMGTHGRTGLAHLLMGSVAEKIVRRSSCPVLTVRVPDQ